MLYELKIKYDVIQSITPIKKSNVSKYIMSTLTQKGCIFMGNGKYLINVLYDKKGDFLTNTLFGSLMDRMGKFWQKERDLELSNTIRYVL